MNLQFRLNELFARRRGNNFFAKLIAACLAPICLCCLCMAIFWLGVSNLDTRGALVFSPDSLLPAQVGQPYCHLSPQTLPPVFTQSLPPGG